MRSFRLFKSLRIALCLAYTQFGISAISASDEPLQLTHDGRQKSSPLFQNGGKELVYVEFQDPDAFQLRRIAFADDTNQRLHPMVTFPEFEPAVSADGERLACLKLRGVLSVSILIRDRSGTILNEIAPGAGFNGYRSPALAPDHSRLAFAYAERGAQQIYSTLLDGSDRKQLTSTSGVNNWPSYSPLGDSIVFGSSRDGNFDIYHMNVDGTNVQRLTTSPRQDVRPRYSPDGQRIVFTSHRDGNAEIYVMNADGSKPHRVTNDPELDDYADWHPDGRRLVFVRERDGRQDLCLQTLVD